MQLETTEKAFARYLLPGAVLSLQTQASIYKMQHYRVAIFREDRVVTRKIGQLYISTSARRLPRNY